LESVEEGDVVGGVEAVEIVAVSAVDLEADRVV
jgi:hypothetical protein